MSKLTQDEILVLKMINKAENNQKYEGTDFKTEKDKISNWEDLIKSLIQKGYLNGEIIVGKGGGEVINLGKKQLTEKAEKFLNKKEAIVMKILCFAVVFFCLLPVFVVMTQKNDINNTSNTIKTNSDKQQKATVASTVNTNEKIDYSASDNEKNISYSTKDREYYMDLMVAGQLACQNYLKAKSANPNSLKFRYRINNFLDKNANNELSLPYEIVVNEISEGVNDVYIYGTLTGDNSYGGKVQQNFTCQVRVDKPNDKFYVTNSIIDNSY